MSDWVTGRPLLVRTAAIIVAFLASGAMAGALWEWRWDAPQGLAIQGQWILEPAGPDLSFDAAALYIALALPLGIVMGLLISRRPRHELATVVTVLCASVMGGLVMYAVGHALGPPDPYAQAGGAADYTAIAGSLVLGGADQGANPLASTALLAMPFGAMVSLSAVYLLGYEGMSRTRRRYGDAVNDVVAST